MKIFIRTFTVAVIIVSSIFNQVQAQEKGTNDIGVNIGLFTTNDFFDATSNIIVSGTSLGSTTYENTSTIPAIVLTYKIAVKDKWLFYADGVYQSMQEDVLVDMLKIGDINHTYLTFGFGTEYHYISKEWFQMYSGASIAYSVLYSKFNGSSDDFEDGNDGYINFHVNALGFRVGKALAATLEVGVGYKGIANLGVSYQF